MSTQADASGDAPPDGVESDRTLHAQVCIAGGGPAGMVLGYLLARSGCRVAVLEKHADFLRDFRGDTVHPSTLEVLQQCGLLEKFNALPQQRVQELSVRAGDSVQPVIDFRGLRPFDFLALVPQWDFLDLIAREAARCDTFRLCMEHEVTQVIHEGGRVGGVRCSTPEGNVDVIADLTVACDGRHSTVRNSLGLDVQDLGAPMDALWFRIPRAKDDPDVTGLTLGAGRLLVLLNRTDYWQAALVVPKGSEAALREQPIEALREIVSELSPLPGREDAAPRSWDDVKTLVVSVNRLRRWHAPGVLLIGDAAHAMSPIGGVGINLAVQDAVAAGNILAAAMHQRIAFDSNVLRRIQQRREWPTRLVQRMQLVVQNRVVSPALERSSTTPSLPVPVRWLFRCRRVRNLPARFIGYGVRRERVDRRYFVDRHSRS